MYCPKCGKQNVVKGDSSPNGGELYIAEGMEGCDEFYSEAHPYYCTDCETTFYLGGSDG